jgi:fibronectin type 3 domain-containing protein
MPPRECPPFVSFPEPAAVNGKGDHRVILSWNASAPADADHADAIGYCIYRGTKSGDRSLVRVNRKPFRGTTCTDNMVQNGETYFYKVRAISAQGYASKATNLVPAHIPNGKPSVTTTAPPPSCQVADAVQ